MNREEVAVGVWRKAARVLLSGALTLALVAESTSAQEQVELLLEIPMSKALLIEGALSAEVTLELTVNGERQHTAVVTTESYRFLDEYEVLDAESERGTRDILSHLAELNGDVVDPPVQGTRFLWTGEDGQQYVELDGPQVLDMQYIYQQLNAFESLWLWAEFPESLAPGSELEVDLLPIAPLLLSLEGEYDSATLTGVFLSQDAKGHASFVGQLQARGRSLGSGLEAVFTGEMTLVTAPAEGRIVSIETDGRMEFELPTGIEGLAKGTFSTSIQTSLPRSPDKLRRAAPKIRMATRICDALEVSVELPSYWGLAEAEDESGLWMLLRSVNNESLGDALITFEVLEGDHDDVGAFRDELAEELSRSGDEPAFDSPKSSLGKGLGLELLDRQGDTETVLRTEFYPLKKGWFAYRLMGPREAFDEAFSEYKKARKTLKIVD